MAKKKLIHSPLEYRNRPQFLSRDSRRLIFNSLHGKVIINEPLSRHTTLKIGGPARIFIEPKNALDLKTFISLAKKHKLAVFVIGAGSNILVADHKLNVMVFKFSTPDYKKIIKAGSHLKVGSAVMLSRLVSTAKEEGLSGLEFLVGIPGTVGGALAMNAGAWGKSIADILEKVTVIDCNGKIEVIKKNKIKFGYRKSNLAKYIIMNAVFKLAKKNKKVIQADMRGYLENRRNSQDNSLPNAGCIFKNPSKDVSAGRLIDLCGLKGKKIGGARISLRHANFILNCGNAKASDVLKLMNFIIRRVKHKFNIKLEPEIKIWR
jgi:UDP-N-acetylmuramate dehydrogenase